MDQVNLAKNNWSDFCHLVNDGYFRDEREYESVLNTIFTTSYRWRTARQEEFPIGNHNKLRLDISLKDPDGHPQVIIEVKSRDVQIGAEELNQISSYLKQTKVKFGLLIGRHISIIYNPPESDPIKLIDIPFDVDNPDGVKLSNMLYCPDFSAEAFEALCSAFRSKLEIEDNAKQLRKKLLSTEGIEILKTALSNSSQLLDNYNPEAIKKAIEHLKISEDRPATVEQLHCSPLPKAPRPRQLSSRLTNASINNTGIIDLLNSPSSALTGQRVKAVVVDGHRIEQYKWTKIVAEFLAIAMEMNREAVIGYRHIFASQELVLSCCGINAKPCPIGDTGYYFNSHSDTATKIESIIKPIARLVGIKTIYCEVF